MVRPSSRRKPFWQDLGTVATLFLLLAFVLTLKEPITNWLVGEKKFDREVLQEWIREARVHRTLPELLEEYFQLRQQYLEAVQETRAEAKVKAQGEKENAKNQVKVPRDQNKTPGETPAEKVQKTADKFLQKQDEIRAHLTAILEPVTKIYKGQLPLFPVVYQTRLSFNKSLGLADIVWESELPRQKDQYNQLEPPLKLEIRIKEGDQEVTHEVTVQMQYHLRVFASREYQQRQESARMLQLGSALTSFLSLLLLWYYLAQGRERERQRKEMLAEQQLNEVERKRLEEALRRQEAERKHEEAERANLELKSQLWANIGVLAGSYAHNIKNLLVRPNDLLARCIEVDGLSGGQQHMLQEVRSTLGTVTERLQQILHTVRRDPTQSEHVRINLNDLIEEMRHTWQELARDKWKITITLELSAEPLWIEGDRSHLQQAMENLLFNARDATFEMRSYLRDQARQAKSPEGISKSPAAPAVATAASAATVDRRQALIAAASWRGEVVLRTRREGEHAVFEIQDNGIGMSEEVRQRCTETHYTTKRNNALFAGFSSGMGLGLSFIRMILDHHQAAMSIDSQPLQGATFRISFPSSQSGLA